MEKGFENLHKDSMTNNRKKKKKQYSEYTLNILDRLQCFSQRNHQFFGTKKE
jgi:hypothetical protein